MPARTVFRCTDGYACDLAATPDGWVLAAVGLPAVDEQFVRNMDHSQEWEHIRARLHPGRSYAEWGAAVAGTAATLQLIVQRDGRTTTVATETAEQFSGVAVVGSTDPAYLWTAYDGEQWSVTLRQGDEQRVLYRGAAVALGPAIVRDDAGTLWYAWTSRAGTTDTIHLSHAGSSDTFTLPGRLPSLTPVDGGVAVCFERPDGDAIHVYGAICADGALGEPVRISSRQPLNFQPRCATAADGRVIVAWETSPAWGFDTRVEQFREIELQQLDPASGHVSAGPGTDDGVLPIPPHAYHRIKGRGAGRGMYLNMNPSNVHLLGSGDDLLCTFRMFDPLLELQPPEEQPRARDAWDLCVMRWQGEAWSAPQRVTEAAGFSHHPYGVAVSDGDLLAAVHCFEHAKFPPRGHRIEVLQADGALRPMHDGHQTFAPVPVQPTTPITHTPALPDAPDGLRLVFGDLHNHTNYSSCYPALDGIPDDNFRWQKDILGHEVLCITDHMRLSDADYRQRLDALEREHTAERVPLYSLEWARPPWHHSNFFTYDKQVMKRLRQIVLASLDYSEICEAVVAELPANSVAAIRHWHGDTHTFCYDQRVEWGMEVLHGRGDELATEPDMAGHTSPFPFPANFIEEQGAKLALIGGSDHHMSRLGSCVTGFWVSELTGEAVFAALRNRRTVACANGKLALWLHSDGVAMGQEGTVQAPSTLTVSAAAPLPIERLSLWRDGQWIQEARGLGQQIHHTFTDVEAGPGAHYYIVRAQTEQPASYPKGPIIGYTAPIWLTVR